MWSSVAQYAQDYLCFTLYILGLCMYVCVFYIYIVLLYIYIVLYIDGLLWGCAAQNVNEP